MPLNPIQICTQCTVLSKIEQLRGDILVLKKAASTQAHEDTLFQDDSQNCCIYYFNLFKQSPGINQKEWINKKTTLINSYIEKKLFFFERILFC
jgi:hypothetical protein